MHGDSVASRTGRAPQGALRVDPSGLRALDMRAEIEQLGTQGRVLQTFLNGIRVREPLDIAAQTEV